MQLSLQTFQRIAENIFTGHRGCACGGRGGAAKSIKGHVESHLTGGTTLSLNAVLGGGRGGEVKVKVRKNPSHSAKI